MNQMTASLLIAELKALGPVVEPVRDGMRLESIEIGQKEGRPIAVFGYDSGRKATIGVGDGDCGITAFAKDDVVVAFARMSLFAAREFGLDMTLRSALDKAGIQVVPNIERMTPADIARCVGPIIDVAGLDEAPRYADVLPSLSGDELAIARSATWTPNQRYRRAEDVEKARSFAAAKERPQSNRNPNYVPAWGVRAAAAETSPTPSGRVPLGRNARR